MRKNFLYTALLVLSLNAHAQKIINNHTVSEPNNDIELDASASHAQSEKNTYNNGYSNSEDVLFFNFEVLLKEKLLEAGLPEDASMPDMSNIMFSPDFQEFGLKLKERLLDGEDLEEIMQEDETLDLFVNIIKKAYIASQNIEVEEVKSLGEWIDYHWANTEQDQYDISSIRNSLSQNLKDKSYFNIWDTDHRNANHLYGFVAQESFVSFMADEGIKNICIEQHVMSQPLVDKYANGEISAKTFIGALEIISPPIENYHTESERAEYLVSFARLIDHCHDNGIAIDFMDRQGLPEANSMPTILTEYLDFNVNATIECLQEDPTYFDGISMSERTSNIVSIYTEKADAYFNALTDEELENLIPNLENLYQPIDMGKRFARDPELATEIEKTQKEGKTAVLYGAMHSTRSYDDIDASLGIKNVFNFAVFLNEQAQEFFNKYIPLEHKKLNMEETIQNADTAIYLNNLEY